MSTSTMGDCGMRGDGFATVCRRLALTAEGIAGEVGAFGAIEPRGYLEISLGFAEVAPTFATLGDLLSFLSGIGGLS